jgi:hypothetical protein
MAFLIISVLPAPIGEMGKSMAIEVRLASYLRYCENTDSGELLCFNFKFQNLQFLNRSRF